MNAFPTSAIQAGASNAFVANETGNGNYFGSASNFLSGFGSFVGEGLKHFTNIKGQIDNKNPSPVNPGVPTNAPTSINTGGIGGSNNNTILILGGLAIVGTLAVVAIAKG